MDQALKILLLEDNVYDAELIERELHKAKLNFKTERVDTRQELLDIIPAFEPDLIISDFNMPQLNALEALELLKENNYKIPFILVTGSQTEEVAVDCIRQGANDYILKYSLTRLPSAIENVLKNHEIEKEKLKAEKQLKQSEERYRFVVENIKEVIFQTNEDGEFTFLNSAWAKITGYTNLESLQKPLTRFLHPDDRIKVFSLYQQLWHNESIDKKYEVRFEAKNGQELWFEINPQILYDQDHNIIGTFGSLRDITGQKRSERRLKASLEEKNILLKEVYHRVKNNLQVIASMLSIQNMYLEDEKMKKILEDSQNRIFSIALVHQKLYASNDLSSISVEDYFKELVGQIAGLYNDDQVEMALDIEHIKLDIDTIMPMGLITNEIITNSFKYAFRGVESPQIDLKIVHNKRNQIVFQIGDNGRGFQETPDIERPQSLGMQLINLLGSQLNAELTLENKDGVVYTFVFTAKNAK